MMLWQMLWQMKKFRNRTNTDPELSPLDVKYIQMWMQFFFDHPLQHPSTDYFMEWIEFVEMQHQKILELEAENTKLRDVRVVDDDIMYSQAMVTLMAQIREEVSNG